jgi:hypothetical protein
LRWQWLVESATSQRDVVVVEADAETPVSAVARALQLGLDEVAGICNPDAPVGVFGPVSGAVLPRQPPAPQWDLIAIQSRAAQAAGTPR